MMWHMLIIWKSFCIGLKLSFIFLCQDCTICMEALAGPSGYKGPGVGGISRAESVGRLAQCGHQYHLQCLVAMYNNGNKDGSLQCPTCKTIYGVKTGNQPPGKMEYHVIPHSLPGHPDCKTIRIIYNIPPGIQVDSVYRCLCGASSKRSINKSLFEWSDKLFFFWSSGPRAPKSRQTLHCTWVPQTLLPSWQREGTQGKHRNVSSFEFQMGKMVIY